MRCEIKIVFEGLVQGVCFRKQIKRHADNLNLFGYAKNLSNENVEVIALGEKVVLNQFLKTILSNPGRAKIHKYQYEFLSIKIDCQGFLIL